MRKDHKHYVSQFIDNKWQGEYLDEAEADLSLERSKTKNISPQIMNISSRAKNLQASFIYKMNQENNQETPKFKVR